MNATLTREPLPLARLWLFLTLGVFAVGFSAILIRWSQAPSLVSAFGRVSFALVLLLPIWFSRERRQTIRKLTGGDQWALAISGFCLGIHFWSWFASLNYTSVAASVLLVTTNPIWVGLLSPFLVGRRLSRQAWVGIGVATLGGIWIALDAGGKAPTPNPLLGNGLALLGSIAASGYILMGRRVRPHLDLWSYAFCTLLGAWVTMGIALLGSGQSIVFHFQQEWWIFLTMAAVPQLIGHNSINWSLRYISADMVAVILLCEPVASALYAWWLLSEPLTLRLLLGALLLLAGVALVIRRASPAE
jgi:drug/metabolite transporter (DMT)-like permease